jgi:regulation of enolase protein 1 (concanavalin A-like superfamily)
VTASGADIWGTADAFHFVYQPLTGDGSIEARVGSIQKVDNWSKAGVMIRETLDPGSAQALMLVSAAKGVAMQWRPTKDGSSFSAAGSTATAPRWVRVTRSGDTISGFESADGVTWLPVSTQTIPMAATVYVGLAAVSHNSTASTTALIDQITVP